MKNKKHCHMVAFLLLIIGGLNWLLLGVFGWEIGELFGGSGAVLSRIIYILVGLAAIYELYMHKTMCCVCSGEKCCNDKKCSCEDGKCVHKGDSAMPGPDSPDPADL